MMDIPFQKKPCLSQYQLAKNLDVQRFPLARNHVFEIWDLPRDARVILTSLTSLNERKKPPTKNTPKNTLKRTSRLLLVPCWIAVQAIFRQLLSRSIQPTVVWQLQRRGYPRVNLLSLCGYAALFLRGVLLPSTLPGSVGKIPLCSIKLSSPDKWRTVPAFPVWAWNCLHLIWTRFSFCFNIIFTLLFQLPLRISLDRKIHMPICQGLTAKWSEKIFN